MLRKASDIVRDLAVAFPQDQLLSISKGRGEFSYIPWNVVVQVLDRIFGTFGWSAEPISYTADAAHGVYLAAVKLTVSALDDEGNVITISRPGFGRGVATPPREEAERGIHVATNLAIHDTAASAAGSDALVKATKLLGDAFGLYLYNKTAQRATAPAQARTYAAGPAAPRSGSGHPTAKQRPYLLKAGYTDAQVDAMTFDEGKAALDAFFQQGRRADGTTDPEFGRRNGGGRAQARDEEPEPDGIPF